MQLPTKQLQVRQSNTKQDQEDLVMSNVVYTFTLFHTLAAVTVFGFMVVSVVRVVSRQKD